MTLEEKDYQDQVKKRLKDIAKTHAEPGFRPGKVPMGLIEKKYGASVKYDVVNKEIGNALMDYIKEQKLPVLGQPIPVDSNIFNEDAKDFNFKFKVGLAPEIDDHVNKDLHVPYYNIEVSEKMVDEQTENLRNRFSSQVPGDEADAQALVKGEIVELDAEGNPKEGGIVVENGIVLPRYFTDDAQKELFLGKHVGDTVKFNPAASCNANPAEMSSMLNIDKDEVENHKGDFNFNIKEIIVVKPAEMNQEFFDMALGKDKAHNEEEFKKELKSLIALQLQNDSDVRFSIDARNEIEKAVGKLELPDEILKDFLMRENEGLDKNNIDEEYEKMLPQLTWDLISDEIASRLDVKIDQEDLRNEASDIVVRQLSQYGPMLNEQLINHYVDEFLKDEKSVRRLAKLAASKKTFAAIKENVTLDPKAVTVEEFNALFATPSAQ